MVNLDAERRRNDLLVEEESMACISPDGKPTESGTKMLRVLKEGLRPPEEIAGGTSPLFSG